MGVNLFQAKTLRFEITETATCAPKRKKLSKFKVIWNRERLIGSSDWGDVPATMPAKNIEIIGQYTTGIGTIQADMQHAEWYTIEGRRISAPRKGQNIMRKADGTVKKVMVK